MWQQYASITQLTAACAWGMGKQFYRNRASEEEQRISVRHMQEVRLCGSVDVTGKTFEYENSATKTTNGQQTLPHDGQLLKSQKII